MPWQGTGERCRNKPVAAGAGDSRERLLAPRDRPFEEREQQENLALLLHSSHSSLCQR